MDFFKTTLAQQKLNKLTSGKVPIIPLTQTLPQTQGQIPRSTSAFHMVNAPRMQAAARVTSSVQPAYPSPPLSAPGQEVNVTQQNTTTVARSIFDLLHDWQIKFSNSTIKNLNYKAEMFTREEAEKLQAGSVFVHSDGVIRYHQEARGEIRQTPLYLMDA
jgi:hypothetical protein